MWCWRVERVVPGQALAVGVDLLGELGDALAQLRGQAGVFVGEGEFFKAIAVVVGGVVSDTQPATGLIGESDVRR